MKLYHGTAGVFLPSILDQGLKPRGKGTRGNWSHTILSSPYHVYLTDSYAPYFAFSAVNSTKTDECIVLEVDTDKLETKGLVPDEDCLEQAGRGHDGIKGDTKKRTLWYRNNLWRWMDGESWTLSLQALGTCAYLNGVPPRAITRIARWPHKANIGICFIWDPTISIINQRICGDRYRALTALLFGDPMPEGELENVLGPCQLPPIVGLQIDVVWPLPEQEKIAAR